MAKTRVGVLIRDTMNKKKSTDLEKFTEEYNKWCQKIRLLVNALKNHMESLQKIEATRMEVARTFGILAKNTPLFDCVGLMPSEERPAHTVCSFLSIHDELGAKTKSYCGKFQQFVLDYAVEWEKVVRTRIDNGLKKAEEMRRDLDHYQKKVEALRLSTNQSLAKGKSVGASAQEKLQRNEEKLLQSKQNYNRVATDLVILMEEVTERSWRDLHPLLIKCAQFDMTLSSDEAKALGNLNNVVNILKQIANDKGIASQPRLKDLGALKPELISTRPGGVAGLQIEYASNGTATTSPSGAGTAGGETALQPGSVGPQGMGGFPVSLTPTGSGADPFGNSHHNNNNNNNNLMSSNDPYGSMSGSNHNAMSNFGALTISTNPSTDIYGTYTSPTGSMPQNTPTPPASQRAWNPSYRSTSFDDAASAYSGYSGYSAPPLSAPPLPPPSMPPPPPPPPSSGGAGSSTGYGLPPMAPMTQTTSYGSVGGGSAYGGSASPWSSSSSMPMQQSQQQQQQQQYPPNQMPMYGGGMSPHNQQQQQQQQQQNLYNPQQQQTPPSNPGYNPFG